MIFTAGNAESAFICRRQVNVKINSLLVGTLKRRRVQLERFLAVIGQDSHSSGISLLISKCRFFINSNDKALRLAAHCVIYRYLNRTGRNALREDDLYRA